MKKLKNKIILTGISLLLAAGAFQLWNSDPRTVPDLNVKTISNKTIHFQQLKGQVILVIFWATNCPACVEEIPDLIRLYQQFHDQRLEIIAINMPYDIPSHVVAMQKQLNIPYDIVLDLKGEAVKAFGNIQLTPTSMVIDKNGLIVEQKTGRFVFKALQSRIRDLIKS